MNRSDVEVFWFGSIMLTESLRTGMLYCGPRYYWDGKQLPSVHGIAASVDIWMTSIQEEVISTL